MALSPKKSSDPVTVSDFVAPITTWPAGPELPVVASLVIPPPFCTRMTSALTEIVPALAVLYGDWLFESITP
jgi:hypothetical protein